MLPLTCLAPHSKVPVKGQSWKENVSTDPAVHKEWVREGFNLGFVPELAGCTVVDFDRKDDTVRDWYRKYKSRLGPIVETRRGIHAIFQGLNRTRKFEHGDIKGIGSYTVFPTSTVLDKSGERWKYVFARGHDLDRPITPFPVDLFPDPRKEVHGVNPLLTSTQIIASTDQLQMLTRAMTYASMLPPAVHGPNDSGQQWHNDMFRFCCKMVRRPPNGFGLSIESALPIALSYNRGCLPPFKESAVLRKLLEAQKKDH